MKISSIVLLLAIIGASLQQTAPAPSCSRTDTANNNRFALKWLEDKKVTIHSTPQTFTDTTVCGGLWAKEKTCCDLASIKDLIRTQNNEYVQRWKSYIRKLARVRNFFPGISNLISKSTPEAISKRWAMVNKDSLLAAKFKDFKEVIPADNRDFTFL